MKLLFDENLSRKLAARLAELFPGSRHVCMEDLLHVPDRKIWEFASDNAFTIVTADGDYVALTAQFGPPPKVIWLRGCDYPTRIAEDLLRCHAIRIAEFIKADSGAVLVLRPSHSSTNP